MLKLGVLLLQTTYAAGAEVPVPQPGEPILTQPTRDQIPIPIPVTVPVPVPTPFPVPVPVIVTVPVPVPVGLPADSGAVTGEEAAATGGGAAVTDEGAAVQGSVKDSHWQADSKYIITLAAGASVRNDKSSTSAEVTKYEYGTVFDVLEHAVDEFGDEQLKTKDGWISAACHDTGEHVADHVLPETPGELYMATAPKGLIVRGSPEKSSDKVGVFKRGEMFHVLERALNSEGVLRMRTDKGWVSESCSKTEERVSEPVTPKSSEHYTVTSAGDVILYEGSDLAKRVDHDEVYHNGDKIIVIERFITPDTKRQLLRTAKGWFAEKSESGDVVAKRTRKARPDPSSSESSQSCAAHPKCDAHGGLCCPTENGVMMQCCDSVLDHWVADGKYIITMNEGVVTTDGNKKYEFGDIIDVLEHAIDEATGVELLKTADGWINAVCSETGEHVADHLLPSVPELYMATAPKGLVVRAGLEKSSDRVGSIKRGELFNVLERAQDQSGVIRLRTEDGWVSESCSKGGDRVAEPAAPKTLEKWTVKANKLTLYAEPQEETEVEYDGEYKQGDQVDVIERAVTDDGRLRLRTSQGWFSEMTQEGEIVAERTRGKRPVKADPVAKSESPATDPAATSEPSATDPVATSEPSATDPVAKSEL